MTFLWAFVLILCVLVFTSYLNEKTLRLPSEIALLLSSFLLGIGYILLFHFRNPGQIPGGFPLEYLSEFLVQGVLCFMLFSGAGNITFQRLKRRLKAITLLSVLTTTIITFVYGFLFYLLVHVFGLHAFTLAECLLLGAIVSPTDPIAATSILKKVGLSDDLVLIIEGESLFNDGVGIALFVAISGLFTGSGSSFSPVSFLALLGREIFGAVLVAFLICFVMMRLFKRTKDPFMQICISLLSLTASYVICELLACSSAIAAVVCGIYFATVSTKEGKSKAFDMSVYNHFWEMVDTLLNYVLYIVIGFFFVNIFLYTRYNLAIIAAAIFSCVLARYIGVFIGSAPLKKLPEQLTRPQFSTLLTWAGLKGGLCLALMVDASDLLSSETFDSMIISVFAIVMFTTVVQGLSVERYYQHLKKANS